MIVLLLKLSKFELLLKELISQIVKKKQKMWEKDKEAIVHDLKEVSEFFAGNRDWEGTFQDEHGDYPAGTYVRNPIDTAHTPRSDDGCTIFVKLWQFATDDRAQFHAPFDGHRDTVSPVHTVKKLHSVDQETVEVHRWAAGQTHCKPYPGGVELLVLKGQVREANETFNTWSWLRLPPGAALDLQVGQEGALVWLKHGHLFNPFPAN